MTRDITLVNLTDFSPNKKARQDEYEYRVEPLAAETFTNIMRGEGISIPWGNGVSPIVVFTSNKLLNMRRLKQRGVIRSYAITRLTRRDEIIEEG